MKALWISAIASLSFLSFTPAINAAVFTLFDSTLNNTPDNQGTLQVGALCAINSPNPTCVNGGTSPFPVTPSQTVVGGGVGVQLNTSANSAEYSGYSNYNPLATNYFNTSIFNANTLDQSTGYTITFTVSLDSSTNNTGSNPSGGDSRASFSVIAISSVTSKAIEIGFRSNEIFSQSSSSFKFPEAQTAAFDTTTLKTYTLTVFNSNYSLDSGGSTIINGSLIDYSAFVPSSSSPPLSFNPYNTKSFLFFGDNTGQESGVFTLGTVQLDTTPVPFDFSPNNALIILGLVGAFHYLQKKRRSTRKK